MESKSNIDPFLQKLQGKSSKRRPFKVDNVFRNSEKRALARLSEEDISSKDTKSYIRELIKKPAWKKEEIAIFQLYAKTQLHASTPLQIRVNGRLDENTTQAFKIVASQILAEEKREALEKQDKEEMIAKNYTLNKREFDTLFGKDLVQQYNVGDCYFVVAYNGLVQRNNFESLIRRSVQVDPNGKYIDIFLPLKTTVNSPAKSYRIYQKDLYRQANISGETIVPITKKIGAMALFIAYGMAETGKERYDVKLFDGGNVGSTIAALTGERNNNYTYVPKLLEKDYSQRKEEYDQILQAFNSETDILGLSVFMGKKALGKARYEELDEKAKTNHAILVSRVNKDRDGQIVSVVVSDPSSSETLSLVYPEQFMKYAGSYDLISDKNFSFHDQKNINTPSYQRNDYIYKIEQGDTTNSLGQSIRFTGKDIASDRIKRGEVIVTKEISIIPAYKIQAWGKNDGILEVNEANQSVRISIGTTQTLNYSMRDFSVFKNPNVTPLQQIHAYSQRLVALIHRIRSEYIDTKKAHGESPFYYGNPIPWAQSNRIMMKNHVTDSLSSQTRLSDILADDSILADWSIVGIKNKGARQKLIDFLNNLAKNNA